MLNQTRKSLSTEVSRAAEDALGATGHALESTKQFASEATAAAQRQLGHYAQATRRHVAKQPVTSLLIAAGIGAAVAALVFAIGRARRDS